MYLEETIEALEVQEDSGISNDEPDSGIRPNGMMINYVVHHFLMTPMCCMITLYTEVYMC